jgi:hypothetical protein
MSIADLGNNNIDSSITFSGPFVGFSGCFYKYRVVNNIAVISLGGFTTPATGIAQPIVSTTKLPFKPSSNQTYNIWITDNNIQVQGSAVIFTDGTLRIFVGTSGNFQNTGQCGFSGTTLSYVF